MKEHNKIILQALNDYLKIDKPGFGILIKGDWGCGKTFVIEQWKKGLKDGTLKDGTDNDDEIIKLEPIYVSLNGISSVNQIDEALNRVISPFWQGKFMKGMGKALKIVASAALRVNVNLMGDESPEQLVYTIDPRTLLELDSTKVKGHKILIFDDIERAGLPVKEVLGYINYYVEHVGCHVIMIGDVKKEKDEESFKIIKEKTIGHEYRIEPETEEALAVFVKEVDKDGKLGLAELKNLISYCFNVSGVSNLRILRQSLYDYKVYVSHLNKEVTEAEEFKDIRIYLLANFIIVYSEYKSGKFLMESFNDCLVAENCAITAAHHSNGEAPKETPAIDIQSKYDKAGLPQSHRVLNKGYVECVMNYLLEGEINIEFLQGEVKRDRSYPWERLSSYSILNNTEFKECLDQTATSLQRGDFDTLDVMLMAACSIMTVIKRELTNKYTIEKVLGWCTKYIEEKYFPSCKTLDELYSMRTHAHQCMHYYQGESITEEGKELNKRIEEAFERFMPKVDNKLTCILNLLSDENIKDLYGVYAGAIPDHSVTYSMHPILSQVDPVRFVNGYVKLSNYSKTELAQFLQYHYHQAFRPSNAKEFVHYYEDDLKKLPEIVGLLKEAAKHKRLVDKENILRLVDILTESEQTIKTLVTERDKSIAK